MLRNASLADQAIGQLRCNNRQWCLVKRGLALNLVDLLSCEYCGDLDGECTLETLLISNGNPGLLTE